jgi:hypothetical protein
LLSLQGKQKSLAGNQKVLPTVRPTDLRGAFFAVASSLQATKKSRKKGQEIATLHRATAAEHNSAAGGQKLVGSLRSLLPSEVLCS